MSFLRRAFFPLSCIALTFSCSTDPDEPPAASGGAASDIGSGGNSAPASGGASSGSGGTSGGASSGGAADGSGGSTASGGSSTETGGADGSGGDPGTGGMTSSGTPSAGCDKATPRPDGGKVYVAGESWLVFPAGYDGTTPMPVLFGFHGCGGGNRGDATRSEYTDLTSNNVLGSDYVVAVPLSADTGGCWNYGTDVSRVKKLYDDLTANYCVDLDRVFATGHSSGAQFIVQLLTTNHTSDAEHFNFKGVAPVAASHYGAIAGPVPVMYIQGKNDTVRGTDGKETVDDFVAGNSCDSSSSAYTAAGAGCQSGGVTVDPGCVEYAGCDAPTIWCSHNDPAYRQGNTNTSHGVPCFAAEATDEFFKSLD